MSLFITYIVKYYAKLLFRKDVKDEKLQLQCIILFSRGQARVLATESIRRDQMNATS